MPGAMRGGMRGAMPGAMGGPAAAPRGSAAQEFLAHTGELNLTDQQVVRLAAIARRAHQRDLATRAAMDSARALRARTPRDSTQPRPMRFDSAAVARALAARQTDLRDALAVLTPDQQATAWQTIAPNRGRGMRQAFGARGRRSGPARPRGPER
jgi:hypothetical protein